MTALAFIKAICKSTGLTFAFTHHYGSFLKGEYIQLVFRRPGNQSDNLILRYIIKGRMPVSGVCSVCGSFAESDDAEKAKECLRPLMNALDNRAGWVELALYDRFFMNSRNRKLFSVAGKSFDEIIVKIDLCMTQMAEIETAPV